MENTRQISMRFMVLYGIFFTAWVFWAICGRQVSHAVFRFFYSSSSEEAVCETSIQFRYPEAFQKTLSRYPVFAKLYCEEDSPAVPGLAYTELEEYGCNQMVPQGICIAGEYMLISAYDNGARAGLIRDESYVPQNSVIYILSCGRGEFLTTLILPDVNHVGGLAFDGSRVWIAKSSTGTVSVISYERIEAAAGSGQPSVSLPGYDATISCGRTASFVSFYDNCLWVGTYSSLGKGPGSVTSFSVSEEEGLKLLPRETYEIPPYAQGITFLEQEGRSYMALSASCGRYLDSILYIYELPKEGGSLAFRGGISLPPMSEELVSDQTHTYVLFESGATCYSRDYLGCPYPVDRVCGMENGQLLAGAGL